MPSGSAGVIQVDRSDKANAADAPNGGDASQSRGSVQSQRYIKGSMVVKPPNLDGDGLIAILKHPMNLLLIFLPLGLVARFQDWDVQFVFWFIFLAMIPLAKIMGDATEEMAAGLQNDMLAGLLNATFGNAVEMVITVNTLRAGMLDVVKATLLGSVLSNMLLVLGMSFFFGGIMSSGGTTQQEGDPQEPLAGAPPPGTRSSVQSTFVAEKVQRFDVLGALVNTSMLLLSCMSFCLVTVFSSTAHVHGVDFTEKTLLPVSRICSLIVASAYAAYIFFQLGTHSKLMADGADGEGGDGEGADEPQISVKAATLLLAVTTVLVAIASEVLVQAIEGVTEKAHMSQHFIGIILLPIVGNACEHAAAVRFAIQDKPGLSIGIAVGSSTQISLFVVPFAVIFGWCIGQPMDLNFGALNTTVMTLSVIVVLSMVVDGQSNWLQGYLLCAAYAVVCVLYWHLPNDLPDMERRLLSFDSVGLRTEV